MQIKLSSGERAELMAPDGYASAAIVITTETRCICEIVVENGLVTKVAIREQDGSWTWLREKVQ